MFKKLKNKIQNELEKEQTSTNASMCSSMSSSRADLTQEEQNLQKQQAFDSLAALVSDDIEEEDDSEEIVQKFTKPPTANLMGLNDQSENQMVDNNQLIKKQIVNQLIESNSQVDEMNNEFESKINKLDNQSENYQKLKQELKEQIDQNKKLENLNINLQNTKHEENLRNNKLFNKLDEMKKQSYQMQDKINRLKNENHKLIEKNEELQQRVKSMRESLEFEKEEKNNLKNELNLFKSNVQTKSESIKNDKLIDELKLKIIELEDQISEKNKIIKLQNQRIHDIKKSVHKGDLFLRDEPNKVQNTVNLENGYSSINGSSTKLDEQIVNSKSQLNGTGKLNNNKDYATHVNDINFKYLQNVVLKFITSNDHESQKQLVKAISTLLKFSKEEEQIIKQSLELKTSWFKI